MSVPVPMAYSPTAGSSQKYSGKYLACVFIFTVCATAGAVLMTDANTRHDFDATAPGLLDDNYVVRTVTRSSGSKEVSYVVSYTFAVNGQLYRGKDTTAIEPSAATTTVYYMAANPTENGLDRYHVGRTSEYLAWAAFGLAALAYIWMHWKRLAIAQNPAGPAQPGLPYTAPPRGDAEGEFRLMKHGKHRAFAHVHIGFFLQAAALLFLLAAAIARLRHGSIFDLETIGLATATAALTTLWIYFDRWLCVEARASRFCSGVINLSMFYVPFVALTYATWRGALKLTGK